MFSVAAPPVVVFVDGTAVAPHPALGQDLGQLLQRSKIKFNFNEINEKTHAARVTGE